MYFASVPLSTQMALGPQPIVIQQTVPGSDLRSAAYTNNGSIGPYLSIVVPQISISFYYNKKKKNNNKKKKRISIDCKEQCLIL